ncbi:ABC transporter substrate-binding protein [Sphingomonas bacterium]|uniref:ABC transporter substrate-binding protein n=1 Tax=Sphingomonas bacterium TaxID=1895847 RepID=UPI001C2D4290|nr:extracellular solute-binding protein [Sphingomonas bacterium]
MDRRFFLAGAAASCLGGAAQARPPDSLIVTTYGGSWETFWRSTLLPLFERRTGADVRLDVGFGRTFSANLRAAGRGRSDYSILMMNEPFIEPLIPGGYFERLDLSRLRNYKDLHPAAQSLNGVSLVGMISPIGIGYRTDLVHRPPTSWRDLWTNPEFRGRLGLYNLQNSVGKSMVTLAGRLFGKGPTDMNGAFAALRRLGPVLQTDFNMSTMMGTGEIIVAPYDFGEIARLRQQGLPVACVTPREGLLMWDQSFCFCAGASARELAYRYLDFLLEPDIQLLLARRFFVTPVNRKVVVPPNLRAAVPITGTQLDRILPTDWNWVNRHALELEARWSQTFE